MARVFASLCTILALLMRSSTAQITAADVTQFDGIWSDDYAKDKDMEQGWFQWGGNDATIGAGNNTYGDVGTYHLFRRTASSNQARHQYMARYFACEFDSKVQISFSISGCDINVFDDASHFRMYSLALYDSDSGSTTFEELTLDTLTATTMTADGTMDIPGVPDVVDSGCSDWSNYDILDLQYPNVSVYDAAAGTGLEYSDHMPAGEVFQVYVKFKFQDNYVEPASGGATQAGHLWDMTIECSANPTAAPTTTPPSSAPTTGTPTTGTPTQSPSAQPTAGPTTDPSMSPTGEPTIQPTADPTPDPTTEPSREPTSDPTIDPTMDPSADPTVEPTMDPTMEPTADPTMQPTSPTSSPTLDPTAEPSTDPTMSPTNEPTADTAAPTGFPTMEPTMEPTGMPTSDTTAPTMSPTMNPTVNPTAATSDPTDQPSADPTASPTDDSNNGDAQENEKIIGNLDWRTLTLVIILASLGLCCIFWLLIFVCWKKNNKSEEDGDNMTQMTSTTAGDTGV